jgi:galactokinase
VLSGATCEARLSEDLANESEGGPGDYIPELGSANYAFTVLRRFARNFPHARRGGIISLETNLPPAAGMSSSSAMMIGIFLGLADLNGLASDPAAASIFRSPEALAGYLATVENGQSFEQHAGDRGVGTAGGSEDHTAILCATDGALSQYAFCPVRHERTVPLDPSWTFVIAVSGITANKTGAALALYNGAVDSVRQILRVWREGTGRDDAVLAHALASDADAGERLRQLLRHTGHERLIPRLEQFIDESHIIVPAAAEELAAGNLPAFGALVDRSQALAERALQNQVPETIHLARSARMFGAAAASAFGAGFGGSVWALVPAADARPFADCWRSEYERTFPAAARGAAFLLTRPGPPAHRIE